MDNTIDFFRDVCNTFRITPGAEKFIFGDNKVMKSLPDCVSKTFSQDWSNKVSALNPKETIFPILKRAEDSLGTILAEKNTLLSILDIEQRFTTAEVIIITKDDNGNTIPVYNRNWLLLSSEDKTKHSIMTECIIPNPEDDDSELGVYLPYSGTVFLWIDRISESAKRNNMDIELLFQKVLLHELIHAVLDCNVRDDKLNVYCPDDNVHGIEETLDNFLVLKCYKESIAPSFFVSIENFISKQPSNYALAREVFEIFSSSHLWIEFEGFITTFLSCKISGTVKAKAPVPAQPAAGTQPAPRMNYVASPGNPEDEEEESIRDIIDYAMNCLDVPDDKRDYLQSNYQEFQSIFIDDIKHEYYNYRIKIDGEWFTASHMDIISEITVRNNKPERIIKAIIILNNEEKSSFISMTFSFYNIDIKDYISNLSIINMPKKSSGEYYLITSKEDVLPISRLLSYLYGGCGSGYYHWSFFFSTPLSEL